MHKKCDFHEEILCLSSLRQNLNKIKLLWLLFALNGRLHILSHEELDNYILCAIYLCLIYG